MQLLTQVMKQNGIKNKTGLYWVSMFLHPNEIPEYRDQIAWHAPSPPFIKVFEGGGRNFYFGGGGGGGNFVGGVT